MPYQKIIDFALQHGNDDPLKLILQQKRYPDIDLKLVAQQLEGQQQASVKWPTLASCVRYFFPPKINREQSSSEQAAQYKATLFQSLNCHSFADLTGGMGVDTYFIASKAHKADYFELNPQLADIAQHNFKVLGASHIACHQGNSIQHLTDSTPYFDFILIDPARRNSQGGKVVAFEDCTPNVIEHLPLLRSCCQHLLIKASPMIDISLAIRQLQCVSQVHIVAVEGECKEVLFLISEGCNNPSTTFHCTNLNTSDESITFTQQDETTATPTFATSVGQYLYEPNAALMKGGCYNYLGQKYGLSLLSRNTHLYTSHQLIPQFPGRIFLVGEEVPLNAKHIAQLIPEGKAHVMTRNYPLSAPELQKKLKLKEGGKQFVIAATLGSKPLGWICEKVL